MYPLQVEVNENNILKITQTYESAYREILQEITTASDFGIANRKAILAQIESILEELGTETSDFIAKELPEYYKVGAQDAVKQLKNVGADVAVKEGFNRVHKDAVIAFVDDTQEAFGETMNGILRSARHFLGKATRELMTQKMATGTISGSTLKDVKHQIIGLIQDEGLSALIDKGGHHWSLDRYSEMLFRTKAVEARNRGLANRMVENGYDLVQVSDHGTDHEECAVWEGAILSVSGETAGYDTVADAEASGLFHPNCKHAINAIIPSLAKLTNAYNPDSGEYDEDGESLLPAYEKIANDRLVPAATSYQDIFKEKLSGVASDTGMDYSMGPIKGAERTAEKILYDYNGNVYGMKDVNRSVFFVDDPNDKSEFQSLVDAVESNFGPVDSKDIKIGLDTQNGYASNKISVDTDYGTKAEIQITTKEMWEAKIELGGDKMYGEWRRQPEDSDNAKALYEKMSELYGEAARKTAIRLGE